MNSVQIVLTCDDLRKLKAGHLLSKEKVRLLLSYASYLGICSRVSALLARSYAIAGFRIVDVWLLADTVGSEFQCDVLKLLRNGKITILSPQLLADVYAVAFRRECYASQKAEPPPELIECFKLLGLYRRKQKRKLKAELPPCAELMMQRLKEGQLDHKGRVYLASILLWYAERVLGKELNEAVEFAVQKFRELSESFNERVTRYQVEHIAGLRGRGEKYYPPSCRTVAEHGYCPLSEEERGKCRWLNRLLSQILEEK